MSVTIETATIMGCVLTNQLERSANRWGFANHTWEPLFFNIYLWWCAAKLWTNCDGCLKIILFRYAGTRLDVYCSIIKTVYTVEFSKYLELYKSFYINRHLKIIQRSGRFMTSNFVITPYKILF